MIYAISDLHGCPPRQFFDLLEKAGFSDADFLFVLGDVIDRGEHGVELLRWMAEQPNVQLLLGNHESMLLSCAFLFEEVTDDTLADLDIQKLELYQNWLENGGEPTVRELNKLLKSHPDVLEGLMDYVRSAPLYEVIEASGRNFVLVHGGLDHFDPEKPLDAYDPHDLLWARPCLDTRYYDNAMTVLGHTPSIMYGSMYRGRAVKTDTWICIDAGVVADFPPMLLRLDDLQEFYL